MSGKNFRRAIRHRFPHLWSFALVIAGFFALFFTIAPKMSHSSSRPQTLGVDSNTVYADTPVGDSAAGDSGDDGAGDCGDSGCDSGDSGGCDGG